MKDDNIIVFLNEYVTLKEDINEVKTNIDRLKWSALILIIIWIFILGIIADSRRKINIVQPQAFEQEVTEVLNDGCI